MSRKTRRSISVAGRTYARIATYCRANGQSISGLLERLIAAEMERVGQPEAEAPLPRQKRGAGDVAGTVAAAIFTW